MLSHPLAKMFREMYRKFKKKLVHRLLANQTWWIQSSINILMLWWLRTYMIFLSTWWKLNLIFFLTQNNIFFEAYIPYVCAYLIEGMVTKMPRFMLEVPRTVHNLLFCTHTLCTCYVIKTFLLASFSPVSSKQLFCFVHGQDKKGEQKHTTINFAEFHKYMPAVC